MVHGIIKSSEPSRECIIVPSSTVIGTQEGRHFLVHTANLVRAFGNANSLLRAVEHVVEDVRKTWKNALDSIFMAPVHAIKSVAKVVGKGLHYLSYKIQLIAAKIFGSEATVLEIRSQKTGHVVVRDLLKGKISDEEQFGKDLERGAYFWNGSKLDGQKLHEFKTQLTEKGYKNMSLLLVQSLSGDLTDNLYAQFESNFSCPVRIQYHIKTEGGEVRLSASYIFATKVAKNNENGELEQFYTNFFRVDRQISMTKDDFEADWSNVSAERRVPSLKVEDRYSQDVTAQEIIPLIADKSDHYSVKNERTILIEEKVR